MDKIKAGVVVVTKFCRAGSSVFASYINYIDRKEAVRTENDYKYNLYQDYMSNPEKTTGLFTEFSDLKTDAEKKELKRVFEKAQENDSLMWQTVISFDNRWLEENGLYQSKDRVLDEERLKGITRSAVRKMLEKEGLQNAVWSAAVHYNTDNIHIHIASVEPHPMREKKAYIQYEEKMVNGRMRKQPILDQNGKPVVKREYKGTFKPKSIEACRREVVNEIIREKENNLKINSIIRDSIVKQKREHPLAKDKELCSLFLKLYRDMPDCNRNMWNYNNPILHSLKPQIDKITLCYIEKYHKEEFRQFQRMIGEQTEKYRKAYGGDSDYAKGKMADMYSRMGNAILKEIRIFDKEHKDKTISEDYEQWREQKENELGVINDPPFKLDDLAEKEKKFFESYNIKDTILSQYTNLDEEELYLRWEEEKYSFNSIPQNGFNIEWSKQYKLAKKYIYNKNPEYEKAILILKHEDMKGNILATYELGDVYRFGRGTEIDIEMAEKYYAKSLQGFLNIEAKETHGNNKFMKEYLPYRVGKMYYYGLGTEQNFEKAHEMFEASGSIFSKYMLGKIYLDEQSQYYSVVKGIEHMQKAYEKGNMMAAYQLGKIYADKSKECYDLEKAMEYYKVAAENENALAAYQLGKIYLDENNGKQNLQGAIYYLKLAAEKDSQFATYQLGKIYYDEKYGLKDDTKAYYWFEKSAKEGNIRAAYQMAKIDYGKQNYINAAKLFQKVDDVYSHYYLGKIYLDESKGNPLYNPQKGLKYLRQASSEGNTFASMEIGLSYLRGKGVTRDVKAAKDWLNQAREQGNEYASEILKKINSGHSARPQIKIGGSMTIALSNLKKGLKSEWEKTQLEREHDQIVENAIE